MKKLFSTAAIIAALASVVPASAQRTGPGSTANTGTRPGVLLPGGFGPSSPLYDLNEESVGLSGATAYPQRLALARVLEVMALLGEAACDLTCGELILRTLEIPDEESHALIAKGLRERPSRRLNQ